MTPRRAISSFPRSVAAALITAAVLSAGVLGGCAPQAPVRESRGVLGTAIAATVYGDAAGIRPALDRAYAAMSAVEMQLDPYDATSAIAAINADPRDRHILPPDASEVYAAIDSLGASATFSPALWGVTGLYAFGGKGKVPTTSSLALAVSEASGLERVGDAVRFPVADDGPATGAASEPGFDFGGASKGLALDRAAAVLRAEPAVTGALLSSGSSTLTFGRKDDAKPWRIGVEDPRDPERSIATIEIETTDTVTVSTSGDYQTYFESDGVRYHHILDPATGLPARGTRSLTVYGPVRALDTDILSTALFVSGPEKALEEARRLGVGILVVDDMGRVSKYSPENLTGIRLVLGDAPTP